MSKRLKRGKDDLVRISFDSNSSSLRRGYSWLRSILVIYQYWFLQLVMKE